MASLTAAEAREGIPGLTGTAADTAIDTIIGRVDALIAKYLGFPPATVGANPSFETATLIRYLPGPMFDDPQALALGIYPVQSVTSIYDDPTRGYAADTLVASGDYTLDGQTGIVWLSPTGTRSAWSKGPRAVKATIVAGWSTVPKVIKEAAIREVAMRWRWRHQPQAVQSSSKGGASSSTRIPADDVLPETKVALAGLVLPGSIL